MEWTIRLMYAIILTSITGTILFGAWYGIGHILERMGFINIMYTILRTLLIFWYLPLAFVIFIFYLFKKKNANTIVMIIAIIIAGIILSFLGWM